MEGASTVPASEARYEINALDFSSPNEIMNAILLGQIQLPVWIKIGRSSYQITRDNCDAFARGCLFATSEEWKHE